MGSPFLLHTGTRCSAVVVRQNLPANERFFPPCKIHAEISKDYHIYSRIMNTRELSQLFRPSLLYLPN